MKNLTELLDRPIAFHRPLAGVAGGVLPALMLSQALYWTKRTSDNEGWFWKTQDQWEEETGMGRREQETARARLRQTRFWQEERRGLPGKMYFKVDLDRLAADLLGACQTSMAESAILVRRKAPYKKGATRQTSMAESAKHTIAEITPEITSENTHTWPRVCDGPLSLDPESETTPTLPEASATLTENPADQGEDLVETVFQTAIQSGQEIRNPVAYRAALARAAARGELVTPHTDVRGAESAAAQAWGTYASAYELRYGVAPVRNARVNAQLGQLVSRLGAEEAKHVAAWYVGHNGALYVRTKHPVGLLLRDAEGLHTEWRRRQQVTETDARHVDRRQATANAFAPLLDEAERAAKERG